MKNDWKYALITGATSGIGLELAKLFAADKYNLVIVARTWQDLENTAQQLRNDYGVQVLPLEKDLFRPEAAREIYDEVKRQNIEIDVLVNDAGQGQHGLFVENDLQRELDIIQLNVVSLVSLTKYFLRDMVARGDGKILNVASIASEVAGPWHAVYHATKAFVLSFTEAIQYETQDTGVTVTALLPGVTDTDFFNKADMTDARAYQNEGMRADPATVAKDGYEALMSGKMKTVSGFINKLQVAMTGVTPERLSTKMMAKQNEPVDRKDE